jgi:outer membrane PBP1 activator LpoA protein
MRHPLDPPSRRHRPRRPAAPALCAALALAALAGCTSLVGTSTLPASIDTAESASRRGDHAAAAREFESLAADNAGALEQDYLLRAAREWLAAGRPADARRVLGGLTGSLDAARDRERRLIGLQALAAEGKAAEAWSALQDLPQPAAPPASVARYLAVRQQLAFAVDRPLDGVRAQVARERSLTSDADVLASRRELLGQLRAAATRGVRIDPATAGTDPIVRGWLEAAPLAAASGPSAAAALPAWRARFPGHPAADLLRADAPTAPPSALPAGAHVAVLLPVGGRNSAAANQIREGLLAGYFATPTEARPALRIYDTARVSIAEAIATATRAGAEFIVGPLTRDEVVAAADVAERRPPLLALNFLPAERAAPAPAGFYQFALSPEDEARAVARRALADGRRRAVAIVPANDWGTRVLGAFRAELESGGGQLLASTTLVPGQADHSRAIQAALRIGDSEARHKRLEGVLGTALSFQPRRRADVDLLFVPAPGATARALRPQLRFHRAGDIPTYATSDAFDPGVAANADLDGLVFPDMPWLIGGSAATDALRATSREAFGPDAPARGRLFAFGHDAWRLALALRAGAGALDLDGATGRLSLDADRRIRRELSWAQVRGGAARPLVEPAPAGTAAPAGAATASR